VYSRNSPDRFVKVVDIYRRLSTVFGAPHRVRYFVILFCVRSVLEFWILLILKLPIITKLPEWGCLEVSSEVSQRCLIAG
jgi:hypothetical protein